MIAKTSINPESYLLRSNSSFRSSDDVNSVSYIHDSQINCAKDVVRELLRKKTRRNSIVLSARMQSGKTGVTTAVCNIISLTPLYREMAVDKFFFISGMNDVGLKDQTYHRVINQVSRANVDNTYIGKRSKKNLSKNKFFVLKNSDLNKFEETQLDNSVIFIDESHYGSNEKNALTKFLERNHINWKNTNDLIVRNIYIVSVSATGFSEIFSDTALCKSIVELKPGNGYIGTTELLKHNSVYDAQSDDISEDGEVFNYLHDAYDRMVEDDVDGVAIVRTTKFNLIKSNSFVASTFDIFEMYSAGSKIDYQKFNNLVSEIVARNNYNKRCKNANGIVDATPLDGKPLLVLIKGAYRAGITLPSEFKDYIYMVFDFSAKSDTTAQALLGRMCGYRPEDALVSKTKFYVNKTFVDMYSKWEQNMQNRENIPANKFTYEFIPNEIKSADTRLATKSCGNFAIPLDGEECKLINSAYRMPKDSRTKFITDIFQKLLKKHKIECQYDYLGELCIQGKNNYAQSSQIKRFDSFSETSLVYQFKPVKLRNFETKNKTTELTRKNLGERAINLVLDCTFEMSYGVNVVGGNRRLLVYYIELGQQQLLPSYKDIYRAHKDTSLIK